MTTGTLHLKSRKRSTAKEDFAIEDEVVEELSPQDIKRKVQFDQLDLLDIFALGACIGVSQRVNDPVQVALESYAIGREMLKLINVE